MVYSIYGIEYMVHGIWEFPKISGPFLGVPMIRIRICSGPQEFPMSYSEYSGYYGRIQGGHKILYRRDLHVGPTKTPYVGSMSFGLPVRFTVAHMSSYKILFTGLAGFVSKFWPWLRWEFPTIWSASVDPK